MITIDNLCKFIGYLQDKMEFSKTVLEALNPSAFKSLIDDLDKGLKQLEQPSKDITCGGMWFRAEGYPDNFDFTGLISAVKCFSDVLKKLPASLDPKLVQHAVDSFYATSNKTIRVEGYEFRKVGNFEEVCQLFGLRPEEFYTSTTKNEEAIANFPHFLAKMQQAIELDYFIYQLNSETLGSLEIYHNERKRQLKKQGATKKEIADDKRRQLIEKAMREISEWTRQFRNFENGLQIYREIVKVLTVESNEAQRYGFPGLAQAFNHRQNYIAANLAVAYPVAPVTTHVISAVNDRLLGQICSLFETYKKNYGRKNNSYFYKEAYITSILGQIKTCKEPEDYQQWIVLFEEWVKNPYLIKKFKLERELKSILRKTLRQLKDHCSFFEKPVPSDAEREAILKGPSQKLLTGLDEQVLAEKKKEFSKLFKKTIKEGLSKGFSNSREIRSKVLSKIRALFAYIDITDPLSIMGILAAATIGGLIGGFVGALIGILLKIVVSTLIGPIVKFCRGVRDKSRIASASDRETSFEKKDEELCEALAEELMKRYSSYLPELKDREDTERVAQYAVEVISQHYTANKKELDNKNIEEKVTLLANQLLFSEKKSGKVAHKDDGSKQETLEISRFFSDRFIVSNKEVYMTHATYDAIKNAIKDAVDADKAPEIAISPPMRISNFSSIEGAESKVALGYRIGQKAKRQPKANLSEQQRINRNTRLKALDKFWEQVIEGEQPPAEGRHPNDSPVPRS